MTLAHMLATIPVVDIINNRSRVHTLIRCITRNSSSKVIISRTRDKPVRVVQALQRLTDTLLMVPTESSEEAADQPTVTVVATAESQAGVKLRRIRTTPPKRRRKMPFSTNFQPDSKSDVRRSRRAVTNLFQPYLPTPNRA